MKGAKLSICVKQVYLNLKALKKSEIRLKRRTVNQVGIALEKSSLVYLLIFFAYWFTAAGIKRGHLGTRVTASPLKLLQ